MNYTVMSHRKSRIQVSISPGLVEQAQAVMKSRGFDSLSEFLESLIRDEWDRRSAALPPLNPAARPELNDSTGYAGQPPKIRS